MLLRDLKGLWEKGGYLYCRDGRVGGAGNRVFRTLATVRAFRCNRGDGPLSWWGGAMEAQKPAEGHCFRRLAGMNLVYEPGCGRQKEGKKYPCPDCSFCQFCAETRCLTCRSERNRGNAAACNKLSLQEQILFYEKVNAEATAAG